MPKLEESIDKDELRTLTQLILDFSEVCYIPACTYVLSQYPHSRRFCHLFQDSSWTNLPPM